MNHIRDLLHRVPLDTREAKWLLAKHLNVAWFTVHKLYLDPEREMTASMVLRAAQFFSQYFPCTFEDVFSLINPESVKQLGIVHKSEIDRLRHSSRRRKSTATI